MPRAGDLYPSRRGGNDVHSPLRGLLDWSSPLSMTAQAAGDAIKSKIEDVVAFIKTTTGIDLTGIVSLLTDLETATGLDLFALADLDLTDNIPDLLAALEGIDWRQPGAIMQAIEAAAAAVPVVGPLLSALLGMAIPDDADPLGFAANWGNNLRSILPGVDLNLPTAQFNPQAALSSFVNDGLRPLRLLLGFDDPLPAFNLFGSIRPNLFGLVPHTAIGGASPNLVPDPTFQDSASIDAIPGVDWDPAVGRTTSGSARITADGTKHEILTDPATAVSEGQTIPFEAYARWQNLAGGTLPIQLGVATYNAAGQYLATTTLAAIGAAGSQLTFQRIGTSTDYTVPAGVAFIRQSLVVAATATAGKVWLDDADHHKTQPIALPLVDQLPQRLALLGNGIQDMIEAGWRSTFGDLEQGVAHTVDDFFDALTNIPAVNVGGFGGFDTIADTVANTWNRFFGGHKQIAGGTVTGKSIADAANAAQEVAARADVAEQLGVWANAQLGIRNNNPFDSGMDPTGVSMFPPPAWPAGGDPSSFLTATASAAPVGFWIAKDDAVRGSVRWVGRNVGTLTAFYVDVYRVNNDTGMVQLLHTSADLLPQLSTSWGWRTYAMPSNLRPATAHGDQLAFAFRPAGSGSHQIMSVSLGGWPADPLFLPRRPAATAPGVGDIALTSVNYAGDYPWFSVGIVEGDIAPPYYAPRPITIDEPGTYTVDVPAWVNKIDVVLLGAGGGGAGGYGGAPLSGKGGRKGTWVAETLVRGVDFPQNATTITITVGDGGARGAREQNGSAGGVTRRAAITGGKAELVAAGGAGGVGTGSGSECNGQGAGDFEYLGVPYQGGDNVPVRGSSDGYTGSAPGGGGAGGSGGAYTVAWAGGRGARGYAALTFRQS